MFLNDLIVFLIFVFLLLGYFYRCDEEFAKWVRKTICLWKHKMFAAILWVQSYFVQAKPVA